MLLYKTPSVVLSRRSECLVHTPPSRERGLTRLVAPSARGQCSGEPARRRACQRQVRLIQWIVCAAQGQRRDGVMWAAPSFGWRLVAPARSAGDLTAPSEYAKKVWKWIPAIHRSSNGAGQ